MSGTEDGGAIRWLKVAAVVGIATTLVLAFTFVILPETEHGTVPFNGTHGGNQSEVVDRTTKTGNVSLSALPPNNGTKFMITTGDSPPPDWGYPAQVTVEHMDSNTTYLTTVYEGENFTVDLDDGERYRFVVDSPNGNEHSLGVLEYTDQLQEPVEIVAFPCCHGGDSSD